MKRKTILSEYGYLLVMGLCLACSAALLVSVTIDKPIVAIAREHVPVLRVEKAAEQEAKLTEIPMETDAVKPDDLQVHNSGFLLTEEMLEKQLSSFLPENFPAEDPDVSLEGGMVQLSFDMSRAALKSWLKDQGLELGVKRELLLQMLPRQVELEGLFAVSADEDGLHLRPVSLTAGGRSFSLEGLPETLFSALDSGINALLQSAGVQFSSVEYSDKGLLLK